jgi:DNA segregation ATPase FtsK/SpoIIIE-like protein
VQVLFEAVTTPSPAETESGESAPASGIGLPQDSPFADEFFPAEAGWPYASEPASAASDGASAANEMAATYLPTAPEPVAADATPVLEDEPIAIDEILVSRIPAETFDDSLPMPSAPAEEPSAPVEEVVLEEPVAETAAPVSPILYVPEPEPQPQLTLFTEPVATESAAATSAVATLPDLDLTRLHTMELDPLFHDAMNAVLERGRASAVVLQRQLGIGYARGIRILDQMTAAGLTGPDTPTGSRELRVTREAWAAFKS